MASGQFGISQHVERREDARLLTGGGAYADDTGFEGQAFRRIPSRARSDTALSKASTPLRPQPRPA